MTKSIIGIFIGSIFWFAGWTAWWYIMRQQGSGFDIGARNDGTHRPRWQNFTIGVVVAPLAGSLAGGATERLLFGSWNWNSTLSAAIGMALANAVWLAWFTREGGY